MGKRVVVLGSSFAGMTAAIELRRRLAGEHEVVVVSRSDELVFLPSLIWVPFGLRERSDISIPVEPILRARDIVFCHTPVMGIALHDHRVLTADGAERYDYLVIATGPKPDWAAVPGLGPRGGFTQSIFSPADAELARTAFERLVQHPGPVVVGAVQGASSFSPAYEMALNMAHELHRRGLAGRAPITYVTPEPFVGHLGVGGFGSAARRIGEAFQRHGIAAETSATVREITHDAVHLAGGRSLPFAFAMLAPGFRGVDAVASCAEIVDRSGFVRVDDHYHTELYPEVFAAGVAVSIPQPERTPVPCGVPRTGYLAEEMARVVAHNIAAEIRGDPPIALAPAAIDAKLILDAGDTGFVLSSDHLLEPRDHAWLVSGPEAHWAKVAFEKYFLMTRRA